jgi:hypothetical protein
MYEEETDAKEAVAAMLEHIEANRKKLGNQTTFISFLFLFFDFD